jgi:hypothetical protein
MTASEASVMNKEELSKTNQHGLARKRRRSLHRALNDAIEKGLETAVEGLTPRMFVAVMTMSSTELGRAFKCALRDEVYEARRRVTYS